MTVDSIDTRIDARWIIPVDPDRRVLHDHSLAIRNGLIEAVLPRQDAAARYAAKEQIQLPNHALLPGLINLHTHAAMTLMRGFADDVELMTWLKDHIWPAEIAHVSAGYVFDGVLLACAEMVRGGITCFNDMYFFPEAAARAVLEAKMRAALGIVAIEFPSAYAGDADDYLHKGLVTRDQFRSESNLRFTLSPHAPYTVSDRTFGQIATYAEQLDVPVHIHLHETQDEIATSLAQHGLRPLARLQNLGLLGPRLIAVHAVHLNAGEIAKLAEHGCHVAHCPSSNLKLASGFAPVAAMVDGGVNVGIGTDGAACNNRLDMFEEMRLAALLAKGAAGSAKAVPAYQALRMATINAARALGWEAQIGSLTPGKSADITAVDLSSLETSPCYDIISHLIYVAGREHVTHVWINGEPVLDNRNLTVLDERRLIANAASWRNKMARA